ncbi:HAD family hydrolase [Allosalinactinospora lopnorensis]|uniref:HAD family hydrolase n=1 Tax=Allosalinactinospora lopnorensis TaxID=1352348 RepID=UPI00138F4111|nr:HAD family hydrolase [Allosalinactinospora lopnorensis]
MLLLDACGVLVGEPMGPLFSAVVVSSGLHERVVKDVFRDQLRDDLWSGRISTGEFWERFAFAVGLDHASPEWHEVLVDAMEPLPAAALVPDWANRARLALISNHRHEWLLPVLRKHGLEQYFHALGISSATGVVKPAPEAFLRALGDHPPHAALYVDDKDANVRAAHGVGIAAVQADPGGAWIDEVERWLGPESGSVRVRPEVHRPDARDRRGSLQGG